MVGLSVYAYEAGGATAVGLAALVRMLPAGLAAPFVGLVADRRSRRDVLVVSCAGRAVVARARSRGRWPRAAPLAVVLALATLLTVLQTAQRPARRRCWRTWRATPVELAAANAAWSGLDNASFLLGALLGGALIAATGTTVVFAVTAAMFVLAAVALARIERDPVPEHRTGGASPRELVGGLRAVRARPALALVIGTVAVTTFVEGIVDVLVVVAALTILHLGEAGTGWLNAAWGAGGLAGGVAGLALLHRGRLAAGWPAARRSPGCRCSALAALPSRRRRRWRCCVALRDRLRARRHRRADARPAPGLRRAAGAGVRRHRDAVLDHDGARRRRRAGADRVARRARRARRRGRPAWSRSSSRARARWPAWRRCARCPSARSRCCAASSFLAAVPLGTLENLALRLQPLAVGAGQRRSSRQGEPGDRFYLVDSGTLVVARRRPRDRAARTRRLLRRDRAAARDAADGDGDGGRAGLASTRWTATTSSRSSRAQPRVAQQAGRFAAARLGEAAVTPRAP